MKDATNAALRTALWVFIGLFTITAAGWLQDVVEWASSSGQSPLPGLSVLGYGAVAAAAAAAVGVVNFVAVLAQQNGYLPGAPPKYQPPVSGPGESGALSVALAAVVGSAGLVGVATADLPLWVVVNVIVLDVVVGLIVFLRLR